MQVFVIGATGMAGSAFVQAAVAQGMAVIANGRNADKLTALQKQYSAIQILAKDAFQLELTDFADSDVIIDAFATTPEKAYLHVDLATRLVSQFRENKKVRLGFILGAGSLLIGNDQHVLLSDIEQSANTNAETAIPHYQYQELEFLQLVDNVDWFGISPGLNFVPGPKDQQILTGDNKLMFNQQGQSQTTAGTMATALTQEIWQPTHHQQRFTVIDG